MNRIYKVIFNKAKGLYEVVSELAHNHGKTKSIATDKRKLKLFLTHLSLIASVLMVPISAAAYDGIYGSITDFISAHPEANTDSFGISHFGSKNTTFGYVSKDYNGLTAGHKYLFLTYDTGTGGAEGSAGKIYHYAIDITNNNSDLSDEQKQTVKDLIKNIAGNRRIVQIRVTGYVEVRRIRRAADRLVAFDRRGAVGRRIAFCFGVASRRLISFDRLIAIDILNKVLDGLFLLVT